jgi:hypothetical protein
VIVVNMFLTGFDATTLNTLWADKNLRAHGLIQAYSRTNRILNSVKTYGNIVSFRDLEQETNDALALFGNKDAKGIVLLKPYAEYYKEYQKRIAELLAQFPAGPAPSSAKRRRRRSSSSSGAILRLKNILTAFDDFAGNEILSPRDFQDYQSLYLNLYAEFRSTAAAEKESINDDVVFEIELIKQVEINVDYILLLVERYLKKKGTGDDKEIRVAIVRAINASPGLRNKKDLIESVRRFGDHQGQGGRAVAGFRCGEEDRGTGTHHRRGKPQRPRRRASSSATPSATAASRPAARPSRRSCRRYRGSRRTTATPPRSRPCWTSWPRSSSGFSDWREPIRPAADRGRPSGTGRSPAHRR